VSTPMLPEQFSGLESPAADGWCLETERERYEKRLESPMPLLLEFYDAAFPGFREMVDHLDQFPLDDLTRAGAQPASSGVLADHRFSGRRYVGASLRLSTAVMCCSSGQSSRSLDNGGAWRHLNVVRVVYE
jgi:hypothetical protein